MEDRSLQRRVESSSKVVEKAFADQQWMPQYRYLRRPVFKFCVNFVGPVAATALSFLAADLIMHQLLPNTLGCLASFGPYAEAVSYVLPTTCDFSWTPWKTGVWMAAAAPVMFAKFLKS